MYWVLSRLRRGAVQSFIFLESQRKDGIGARVHFEDGAFKNADPLQRRTCAGVSLRRRHPLESGRVLSGFVAADTHAKTLRHQKRDHVGMLLFRGK